MQGPRPDCLLSAWLGASWEPFFLFKAEVIHRRSLGRIQLKVILFGPHNYKTKKKLNALPIFKNQEI